MVTLDCRGESVLRCCLSILRRLVAAEAGLHAVLAAGSPVGLRFEALLSHLVEEPAEVLADKRGAAARHFTVEEGLFEPGLMYGLRPVRLALLRPRFGMNVVGP